MTTQYSLSDVLPKDATGLPFQALVDVGGSQMDFALVAGIGASVNEGKRFAYQGVATHKQSQTAATTSPGVAMLGVAGTPLAVGGNLQYLWLNALGAVRTQEGQSFTVYSSGSTTASANTLHGLFGTYTGLSLLASSAIVNLELKARTNAARVKIGAGDTNYGVHLSTSSVDYTKIKPMLVSNASALHFLNDVAGSNATINWVVYKFD